LPDTSSADVTVEATLQNHDQRAVVGTLRGSFGTVRFYKQVTVPAASTTLVRLDRSSFAALHLNNPKLWWPAGYGEQNLYKVKLSFETRPGVVSDRKSFQTGVREFSYSEQDGALRIWINGRRFIARGGNWGFPESNLRYRAREYDVAMHYHQDMNFTMIRNWVGQNGEDALYEAADKHGIVIWQDFWLANPWDGPDPDDNAMNIGDWLPVMATFSACWQNNHHHYPHLLRTTHGPGEFDFGYMTVRVMSALGLVTPSGTGTDKPGDVVSEIAL